jgi:Fic family protein
MTSAFKHYDLSIHKPDYDSDLTSVIIELEKLRISPLGGPVNPWIFFQLKNIFHMLESLGSARIEGNNTTLSELVERQIEGDKSKDEKMIEIENNEKAMDFIEHNIKGSTKIDRSIISELHKILVKNLPPPPKGEGSKTPGKLREHEVAIKGSEHKPPSHIKVQDYFEELINFINQDAEKKYNLLITAISHHRFSWIHPFDNANGRVVRLLTYALLIKQNFSVGEGRILNPTAVFCIDRKKYYEMLACADHGDRESILKWCYYVLNGLLIEMKKIDKLLDRKYLNEKILSPAIDLALRNGNITPLEHKILSLSITMDGMEIVSGDIEKILPGKLSAERSRVMRKLRDKVMLMPIKKGARKYVICFKSNPLLRGVIRALKQEGFIPLEENTHL